MIAGPTPPHPRVVLKSLLYGHTDGAPGTAGPEVLEAGLEVREEGLRVGDDLRVDFLARDAAGCPTLILTVDAEDEAWAPLRLLDIDIWFQDNAFLLERGLARAEDERRPLRWSQGHRMFVVTLDVSPSFYRRLQGMTGLDLEVRELRSVFLRGETLWFLQEVQPWACANAGLPTAPEGLEDPVLGDLTERLLLRLQNIAPDLQSFGDRFSREVRLDGRRVLRLEVRDRRLLARVLDRESPMEVRSQDDVDRVLDSLLRVLLQEDTRAPRPVVSYAAGEQPVKLTDEEMAAFLTT